jgi:choline dehydrogenase
MLDAFDAVVVGAGAAGCVVAARLAEGGSRSVLLLEAGPDLRSTTPDALRDGWRITLEPGWGYESEPNQRGDIREVFRGKLLGGTSWVTRFALRGSPADFDEWAALRNPGWGFEDVLPYFTRLEADADFGADPWHGDRGPMPITRYADTDVTSILGAALRALEDAGMPGVDDHNRPGAVGAGRMPMTSRDGARVTTADAYLGHAPANLEIRCGAQVADIVFDADRASGVRLLDGSVVEAGHVILCCGVYGNPPILMRSGIGPPDHLRSVGVPVRVELPGVGANLSDHPAVAIDCGYRGPARADPVLHAAATFHSSATPTAQAPDLMFWISDPEEPDGFEIDVVLLKPRSRGHVRLRSAEPADPPRIELPGLSEPVDVERLAEGCGRALELAEHPEIRRLCSAPVLGGSLDEVRSLPHTVGTCAMGPRPAQGAVVDARGRVHGVDGITIADASIMPDVPSGFTHLSTIMIAERLAEAIAPAIP